MSGLIVSPSSAKMDHVLYLWPLAFHSFLCVAQGLQNTQELWHGQEHGHMSTNFYQVNQIVEISTNLVILLEGLSLVDVL